MALKQIIRPPAGCVNTSTKLITGNRGSNLGFILADTDVKLISDMKQKCSVCRSVINKALQEQSRQEGFYPFCCNRCKLIDLGKWLDSNYRILTRPSPENLQDIGEQQLETDRGDSAGQA